MYSRQLANLRKLLYSARDSIVCGFTGTPMTDDPSSGWQLLRTIKGRGVDSDRHEGFLVSMCSKKPPLFPRVHPRGFPDTLLDDDLKAKVCVNIPLGGETLKAYDLKVKAKAPLVKLQPYCNTGAYCSTFHGQRKAAVLRQPKSWMPKLAAIASAICHRREKAVVLISRQGGYKAMLALLQRQAARSDPPFAVIDAESGLAEFNATANKHGQKYLALVADSTKFCEGTSFKAVKWLYLANVPGNALTLQQQCGRVARMFGHHHLDPRERSVSIVIPMATLPTWVKSPLDAWCLRACCRKESPGLEVISAARELLESIHASGIVTLDALKFAVDTEAEIDTNKEDGCSSLSRIAAQRLLQCWGASHCPEGNSVVQALQLLHRTRSVQKLCATLLSSTVDEDFIEKLSSQLAIQIPALSEFRAIAINSDTKHSQRAASSGLSADVDDVCMSAADLQWRTSDKSDEESASDDGGHDEEAVQPTVRCAFNEVHHVSTSKLVDNSRVRNILAHGWKDVLDDLMMEAEMPAASSDTNPRSAHPDGGEERHSRDISSSGSRVTPLDQESANANFRDMPRGVPECTPDSKNRESSFQHLTGASTAEDHSRSPYGMSAVASPVWPSGGRLKRKRRIVEASEIKAGVPSQGERPCSKPAKLFEQASASVNCAGSLSDAESAMHTSMNADAHAFQRKCSMAVAPWGGAALPALLRPAYPGALMDTSPAAVSESPSPSRDQQEQAPLGRSMLGADTDQPRISPPQMRLSWDELCGSGSQ
jgi:hypothetical protein